MGPDRLRQIARAGYGVELTLEEVEDRIRAYQRLCPELDGFLEDELRARPGRRDGAGPDAGLVRGGDRDVLRSRRTRRPIAAGLARRHAAEGPAR